MSLTRLHSSAAGVECQFTSSFSHTKDPTYLFFYIPLNLPFLPPSPCNRTPLYQLLTHALGSPSNKTRFTLLFSNVTEKDILLREELDALKRKYSDKFDLVYLVDKPSETWKGQSVIAMVIDFIYDVVHSTNLLTRSLCTNQFFLFTQVLRGLLMQMSSRSMSDLLS